MPHRSQRNTQMTMMRRQRYYHGRTKGKRNFSAVAHATQAAAGIASVKNGADGE